MANLPSTSAPKLVLVHPTEEEKQETWTLNSKEWGSALTLQDYIDRERYLQSIPATRDGGITHWVLTDPTITPRPLLASCESLRRHCLLSLPDGTTKEVVTHGIGSVFCPPEYRGKGYASQMLSKLASILNTHQKEVGECPFSILYSDIGKKFYAELGWRVFPSSHVSLPAILPTNGTNGTNGNTNSGSEVTELTTADIAPLIAQDCATIRIQLQKAAKSLNKPSVAILPDVQTMEWHHLRQTFMTSKLFPSQPAPTINGAIAGPPGHRVWIIFTRVFYGPLTKPDAGNKFYILRLVVEDENDSVENAVNLGSVLRFAQREAGSWQGGGVYIWNVTPLVKNLLTKTGLEWKEEERENDSIPSLMWYGEGNGGPEEVEWFVNEKFAWC